MLKGGLVGHIAKEYLSKDGVLDGTSVEVTMHQIGYHLPSGNLDIHWCDNELMEDKIAVICGTYLLYTGKGSLHSMYISNDFKTRLLCGHGFPLLQCGITLALVANGWIGLSEARIFSWRSSRRFNLVQASRNHIVTGSATCVVRPHLIYLSSRTMPNLNSLWTK